MGKQKMVQEAAIDRKNTVRQWPGLVIAKEEVKQPWYIRAAIWTGVIMSNPETPKGWQLNPATVTLALVVAGMIAGGAYYMGKQEAQMQQLLFEIRQAQSDAAKAKERETYNAGSVDAIKGHGNSNTEKKK